jgi:hypothetical protein
MTVSKSYESNSVEASSPDRARSRLHDLLGARLIRSALNRVVID